ncbi:MAG: transposase [Desulfobaccales bacterium]
MKVKKDGSTGFPACAPEVALLIKRRNLPHWQLQGSTYFVTFRLRSGIMSEDERRMVLDAVKHFHKIKYLITTAVVMLDHVHLIMKPVVNGPNAEFSLSKILQSIKGFTARQINKVRGAKGAIWQAESYDRIVRDYDEYLEKWQYIRNNPVKTGLSERPDEYPFLWEPGEALEAI